MSATAAATLRTAPFPLQGETHKGQQPGATAKASSTNYTAIRGPTLLLSLHQLRRWTPRSTPQPFPLGGEGHVDLADTGGGALGPRILELLSLGFPLWVSLACLIALRQPSAFDWVTPAWQIGGLMLAMLGMGMTLTLDDLKTALLMPKEITTGFILQYSVMPLSGFYVSKLLRLPSHFAVGLILLGCCPGGTASNIVTYLARGNVELSVLMTAASTAAAVVMTPFLTAKLAGQFVAVDPVGLLMSTVLVVLVPVLLGVLLNKYCKGLVAWVSPAMPFVAVITVSALCGSSIAQNSAAIISSGLRVIVAVCCLHGSGFFFGYILSRILGFNISSSRTISIQVGMQMGSKLLSI